MEKLIQICRRLIYYFRRESFDRELEEEMLFHLEMKVEENLRAGMTEEEARCAAQREFGNQTFLRESSREMWGFRSIETMMQDLRYGARMLLKHPGFTIVAVLSLSLGIGANTAIFSIVNAVLLRPLPFPEPERIVAVGRDFVGVNQVGAVDDPRFLFWREQSKSFDAMSAHQPIGAGANLSGGGEPEFVPGLRVSVDFFNVLGVIPAIGRSFTAAEDSAGGERVVILSDGLWRRRFGADRAIIGKAVLLNNASYTVIGVMPQDFRFTQEADLFVPLRPGPGSGNSGYNFNVLARLKPGVTPQQALAEMKLVGEQLRAKEPKMMRQQETVNVVPYRDALTTPRLRLLLWILLGAVAFVLLIACANVANLMLARATSRYREIAVRSALGASRRRIIRQLLTEGLLLSFAGATAGTLLAVWSTDLLKTLIPEGLIPRTEELGFDWRVLVFTAALAVATGIVFSLAPAIQASRVDVNHALKEGAGKGSAGGVRSRLRGSLVVVEIALALVLLVGATLLIRTFSNLLGVAPGFDPRGVLTFQMTLSGERYGSIAGLTDFHRRAAEGIKSLPGVEGVAVTNVLPLDAQYNMPLEMPSRPGMIEAVQYRTVTPDYFRVLKMGLRQGREFADTDTAATESVAIVNEAFVRRYTSDASPLGQQIFIGRSINIGSEKPIQIVGVVSDTKQFDLISDAPPTVFIPAAQVPDVAARGARTVKFVIRTAGDPLSLAAPVKKAMLDLDPNLPVTRLRSLEEVLSRSVAQERFNMLLVGIFAGLGLVLAVIGIYGVMSYAVSQRTGEMGIRIALGAQSSDILKLIIKQGAGLALAGVVVGLVSAFGLTRVMKSFLFGVSATDPLTFLFISLLLTAVALIACYIPARRATKVDPMIALRYE